MIECTSLNIMERSPRSKKNKSSTKYGVIYANDKRPVADGARCITDIISSVPIYSVTQYQGLS